MDDQLEPSTNDARQIRELTTAVNFSAVFYDEEDGEPWVDTIVAWALVNDSRGETSQTVVGLVADGKDILFADEFPNFIGYLSAEGSLDGWRERAREAFERQDSTGGHRQFFEKRRGGL